MKASHVRGFTLIELVVVITILGILAAFAIPRFITLDATARTATVNGLAGTVRSAAALARGMAMASGSTASVTMEGNTVTLLNNYPDAGNTGILLAVNASADFTYAPSGTAPAGTATYTRVGAPTPANCVVNYAAAAAGSAPVVTVTTTGC